MRAKGRWYGGGRGEGMKTVSFIILAGLIRVLKSKGVFLFFFGLYTGSVAFMISFGYYLVKDRGSVDYCIFFLVNELTMGDESQKYLHSWNKISGRMVF